MYVVLSSDAAKPTLPIATICQCCNGSKRGHRFYTFLTFGLGNSRVNQKRPGTGTFGGSGLVHAGRHTRGGDGIAATGGFASVVGGNGGVVANVLNNSQMTGKLRCGT